MADTGSQIPKLSSRTKSMGFVMEVPEEAQSAAAMSHDFLFQKLSPLRAYARLVSSNPAFEVVVLLAIVTNVVAMAMEDVPARRAGVDTSINYAVTIIDKVTLVIYTLEFLFRVLSHGLMPLPDWCPAFLRPDKRISIRKDSKSKVVPIRNDLLGTMQAAMDAEMAIGTDDLEAAQGTYYLKSNWNRMDLLVLCISYVSTFVNKPGLSSLRALRALRPLRMIHFVAPLQVILKSIWRAVGTLVDVVICLCFMYLFFALFGQQLFQGSLRRRCVVPQGLDALRFNVSSPGYDDVMVSLRASVAAGPSEYTLFSPETFCSFESEPKSFTCDQLGVTPTVIVDGTREVTVPVVCANINRNPDFGFVNFDGLMSSLWTVFMMTSLEGWTDVMYALMDSEVAVEGAIFSVAIIVVIAFLGIQLFTSALCNSSMHVRVEEALNRRRVKAIERAQRKLWLERHRLRKNVETVASVWRANARKTKATSSFRRRTFSFSRRSDDSTLSKSISESVHSSKDLSGQMMTVKSVMSTTLGTSRTQDASARVSPLPEGPLDQQQGRFDCNPGPTSLPSTIAIVRPFSSHRTATDVLSLGEDGRPTSRMSNGITRVNSDAFSMDSPPSITATTTACHMESVVTSGSTPHSSRTRDDTFRRHSNDELITTTQQPLMIVDNSAPGLRGALGGARPSRRSLDMRRVPTAGGLKQRALAPLRDRVTMAKIRSGFALMPRLQIQPLEGSSAVPRALNLVPPPLDTAAPSPGTDNPAPSDPPASLTSSLPPPMRQRSSSDTSLHRLQGASSGEATPVATTPGGTSGPLVTPQPRARSVSSMSSRRNNKSRRLSTKLRKIDSFKSGVGPIQNSSIVQKVRQVWAWLGGTWVGACGMVVSRVLRTVCRPIHRGCRRLLDSVWFDRFIIGCIFLNAISISSYHYGLSEQHETILQICEFIFAWIFSLEMLVKVFGLGGLRPYFREKQNIFDFIVVSVSLPSIVLPLMAGSISQTSNLAAVSSFRAFRLFRVFRIARLLHKVTSMRNLLSAVLGSFTALMNLLFFIAFALVTFSIAATALFSRSLPPSPDLADAVDHNGLSLYATGQSPRYNFDSFFNSLVSLFIVMTGENWTSWYYETTLMNTPIIAIVFQLFYYVVSNYVLLSLFIAIIVHNFDAKAEEREHQQRTAYVRLQDLVRKRANEKLLKRRRASIIAQSHDLMASLRPKRRSSVVAPEPLPTLTTTTTTTAGDASGAHDQQIPHSGSSDGGPPIVPQATRETLDTLASDFDHLSDDRLLEEARKLGAAMDTTSTPMKDDPPIMEGYSLGCWPASSPFRRACFRIATHKYFEWLIMACILVSGVLLAMQAGTTTTNINYPDLVFNGIFLFEFCVKVVGFGFWRTGKSAYLKNSWNVSDLCILLGSITATLVDIFSNNKSLKFLRVFRLGRALRPLRVIRGNASMRVVVSSLMASFTDVINVYFLSQFVSIMFAIMGVSLFSGVFHRCNNPAATGVADCTGTFIDPVTGVNTTAVWANPVYSGFDNDPAFSFDDIGNAFLVVKEVQVTEGWTEVLAAGMDVTSLGEQPRFNASPMNAFYFIGVIAVGTFFIMQLYTGVIVQSYSRSEGTAFMTGTQRQWIQAKLQILQLKPPGIGYNHDVWWPRRLVQDLVISCKSPDAGSCVRKHHRFHSRIDTFVAVAVGINMIVLMLYHYGMSAEYASALDMMNNVLLGVFALEMALKMFALGVWRYWREPSNTFDGLIVIGSLFVLLLTLNGSFQKFSFITQIARLFRVGRLLRLLQNFPRLRRLFETIIAALPSMGNVTALLLLVLFVGTIVGMELFGDVSPRDSGPGLNRHANFQSFWSGFLLLFRGLTGESINVIARDCMREHLLAQVYFILFNDLVKSVFLNLYLATIIDKLDGAVAQKSRLFKEDFERFEMAWLHYDKRADGTIELALLRPFLRRLKPPLGGPEQPKEFTKWYLSVFPSISCTEKGNKLRYRDVLMALTTRAVDAGHLLVGERVHRDLLQAKSDKMLAALRIQCAYRSFRTRKLFSKIRELTATKIRRTSFEALQSALGFPVGAQDLFREGSVGNLDDHMEL